MPALRLRNAPTGLMKKLDYGKDYQYAHQFEEHFVKENYFPDDMKGTVYYRPTDIGREKAIRDRLHRLWKGMKPYSADDNGEPESNEQ